MAVTDRPWRWHVLLGVTFTAAAVLRIIGLQSGLWYDEIVTLALSARNPVHQIVTEFIGVNAHPLYSLLAHASISAFGEAAWSLRLPACVFGIVSVVMVYVLGARLLPRLEAWAAAAVLATSYHHIWFSQNARGYTLLGFTTLLSTYLLWRIGKADRRGDYIAYALTCAAGIYTQLTMAFVVAAHGAVIVAARASGSHLWPQRRMRSLAWTWMAVAIVSAAAYAPFGAGLLAFANSNAQRQVAQVTTPGWALQETIRGAIAGAGVPAVLFASLFAAIGFVSLLRRQPLVCSLLVAPGVVATAAAVALGQPIRPRYFFFLSGAAAIFVGRGLGAAAAVFSQRRFNLTRHAALFQSGAIVAGTLVLVAMSAAALPVNYELPKQDFDGAVRFLDAAEAKGAHIGASGPACLPLETYYRKSWQCLKSLADWQTVGNQTDSQPVFIVYTLADYMEDPQLQQNLQAHCPIVRSFPGTLGGGEINVCERLPARDVERR